MNNLRNKYDVLIAGGGIVGFYVAFFLKKRNPAIEIAIIKPDSNYEYASTVRASGGARRLFSCPENIEMCHFSIERIKNFSTEMAVGNDPAPIDSRLHQRVISGCCAAHRHVGNTTAGLGNSVCGQLRNLPQR